MGEISGAMVSRLLLLATLALCGLAHSTVEVQELHDDLGPVDPIVMLQREQLGVDSELSMLSEEDQSGRKESAEEKQLTWNCDMAKKCKCAGKMMAQGADVKTCVCWKKWTRCSSCRLMSPRILGIPLFGKQQSSQASSGKLPRKVRG